jgi:hypothetical protein
MPERKKKKYELTLRQLKTKIRELTDEWLRDLIVQATALDARPRDLVRSIVIDEVYAWAHGETSFDALVSKAAADATIDAQENLRRKEERVTQRLNQCIVREHHIAKAVVAQYYRNVELFGAERVHVPNEVIEEIREDIRAEYRNKLSQEGN